MVAKVFERPPRSHNARVSSLLHFCMILFVWVSVVGLNPLTDRNNGKFGIYDTVGTQQYIWFYAGCALISLVTIAFYRTSSLKFINIWFLILFSWAAITLFSSSRPFLASIDLVKQLFFLLGVASFFTLYRSDERLMTALKLIFLAIIAADVIAVITVPNLAIHQINDATEGNLAGSWRGLHEHKGKFGELLAVESLICYFAWRRSLRIWDIIIAITCIILLFPSGSKGSIGGLLITILVVEFLAWWARYARGMLLSTILLPLVAISAIFLSYFLPIILESMFGDTTLSGRTITWGFLWKYSQKHMIFGSGFASFFTGQDSLLAKSGNEFLKHIGHAHNSYLDLLVTMGWPGAVFGTLAFIIVPVIRSYRLLASDPMVRIWLSLVIFAAVTSVTSIAFFQPQRALGLGLIVGIFGIHAAAQRGGKNHRRWRNGPVSNQKYATADNVSNNETNGSFGRNIAGAALIKE